MGRRLAFRHLTGLLVHPGVHAQFAFSFLQRFPRRRPLLVTAQEIRPRQLVGLERPEGFLALGRLPVDAVWPLQQLGIGGGRGLDGARRSRCPAVKANLTTPVELGLSFHGDLLAGRVGIAAQLRLMVVTQQA